MKQTAWLAVVVLMAACAWAQAVPSGWKIVKGGFKPFPGENVPAAPNACRISVPADWVDFIEANNVHEPHSFGFSAEVTASKPGMSFGQQVRVAKDLQKSYPVKGKVVVEDSSKRFWTETKSAGRTEWDVIAPGSPNCNLQMGFDAPADEATAKKIVMSLGPSK
jgi:hypothetical protein